MKVKVKLKYVKPRLGVSTLALIVLDTPNLAFFVLRTFKGGPVKKTPCMIVYTGSLGASPAPTSS